MSSGHTVVKSLHCGIPEVEGASVFVRGGGGGLVSVWALLVGFRWWSLWVGARVCFVVGIRYRLLFKRA